MMSKNLLKIAVFTLFSAFLISCNSAAPKAKVKKGEKPVADNEVAIVEMEQPVYGKFKIEFYSNIAPEMVKRFKELSREGFYNGTSFHRINSAVIQGGDPYSKEENSPKVGTGNSDKPNVPAEFSDIPYDTGILGAARTDKIDTANSQFFITLQRTPSFDEKYTIFGKVVEGMNNIRIIAGAPRDGERPLERLVIKSVTIQPR